MVDQASDDREPQGTAPEDDMPTVIQISRLSACGSYTQYESHVERWTAQLDPTAGFAGP